MNYLYAKYKYSDKIKLLRMVAVIAVAIVCFTVGCVRIFGHNLDAGAGFRGFSWFVLIVVGILVVVVGYLEIYIDIKIEKIYPVIALTLGIVYIALVPAFETPDEHLHFKASYVIADEYLGEDNNPSIGVDSFGAQVLVIDARNADASFPVSSAPLEIDTTQYELYIDSLKAPLDEQLSMTRSLWRTSDNGQIMYYLPAIGIAIGKSLNLNFGWLYFFGVLLNLVFYVVMTTYAINKIPFGKRILFLISLLPITLQQVSSFSYDSPMMACCMVVIAQAFFLKYGDRSTRRNWKWNIEIPVVRISITELIIYIMCFVLLLGVKRGVYSLLIFLPLSLCINKKWFEGNNKKKSITIIVLLCALGIIYVTLLGGYDKIVNFLTTVPHDIRNQVGVDGVAPIEYIQSPSRLFLLVKNTIISEKTHIFNQLGGGVLGVYRIFVTKKVVAFNLLMLLLSMIRYRDEKYSFAVGNRILAFLIGLSPVVISFLAMLLYWTFPWDVKVEGFQGRYVIPTLPVLMMSLGLWKRFRIPNIDNLFIILMTISSYACCISVLSFV